MASAQALQFAQTRPAPTLITGGSVRQRSSNPGVPNPEMRANVAAANLLPQLTQTIRDSSGVPTIGRGVLSRRRGINGGLGDGILSGQDLGLGGIPTFEGGNNDMIRTGMIQAKIAIRADPPTHGFVWGELLFACDTATDFRENREGQLVRTVPQINQDLDASHKLQQTFIARGMRAGMSSKNPRGAAIESLSLVGQRREFVGSIDEFAQTYLYLGPFVGASQVKTPRQQAMFPGDNASRSAQDISYGELGIYEKQPNLWAAVWAGTRLGLLVKREQRINLTLSLSRQLTRPLKIMPWKSLQSQMPFPESSSQPLTKAAQLSARNQTARSKARLVASRVHHNSLGAQLLGYGPAMFIDPQQDSAYLHVIYVRPRLENADGTPRSAENVNYWAALAYRTGLFIPIGKMLPKLEGPLPHRDSIEQALYDTTNQGLVSLQKQCRITIGLGA